MLSFDTNIAVHAANSDSPQHEVAAEFIASLAANDEVVICELMLVELFLKLCNEKILPRPMKPAQAAAHCHGYRQNPHWRLVENAPVMATVGRWAATPNFAFRGIIDVRLAATLRHFEVTEFATTNLKDFRGLGFSRVWNPLLP
ncbi:ribonuclease VapC24 [Verrucomicrobiota bacterium]|nr:ribonuclease VapC24 [Verrucomicrobiota bacterium]